MACRIPTVVLGARNLRIVFRFVEDDGTGKLLPIDLTLAASSPGFAQAWFRKPSGELVSRTLEVDPSPTSGEAAYLTEDGFLDEAGTWEAEGAVMIPGTSPGQGFFPSRIVSFEVLPFLRPFQGADQVAPGDPITAPPAVEVEVVAPEPLVA